MHLVGGQSLSYSIGFYHKAPLVARPGTLPHIFHRLRQHRGLTIARLGEVIGFSSEYISSVESGLKYPSLRYCLACGDLFGANPNWVKGKWADGCVSRYRDRVLSRVGLNVNGGA